MRGRLFGAGSGPRQALVVVAGVVALAAVIYGVAAVSEPAPRPSSVTSDLSAKDRADQLAGQAADALSRDETQTALRLAERALAADPGNTVADRVRRTIRDADTAPDRTPPSDPSTPTLRPPAPGVWASRLTDTRHLLPLALTDWTRGREVVEGPEALVTFEPRPGTPAARVASRVLVQSHDRSGAAGATRFITEVSKKAFPRSSASVTIGAIPDGYSGHDPSRQTVVAFARGRYAFEVIVSPLPGADPKAVTRLAIAVAEQHPAAIP